MSAIDWTWNDPGVAATVARCALWPMSLLYGIGVSVRNGAYDRGVIRQRRARIPVVSVGNLTVGGTGKTPVAAWIANELLDRGAQPAIVLRGYGGDEAPVLRMLAEHALVIEDADRVRGVERAADAGCDIAVLDDGMQHRRLARDADVVLVSADRFRGSSRVLPMGPWREPMSSLRRATYVLVTRKFVSRDAARDVTRRLMAGAGRKADGIASLTIDSIVNQGGKAHEVGELSGMHVVAFAGIGDARSFEEQVRAVAPSCSFLCFPDHHAYSSSDVSKILSQEDAQAVVCTLKDYLKVRDLWPRQAPPLWYFSQRLDLEEGRETLDALLKTVLECRHRRHR